MLHAALLAAALDATPADPTALRKSPIRQCFASMDGAVYHGDPSNRLLMQADVAACTIGAAQIEKMHASARQGPQKLFVTARILDRSATLSYMGLGDADTALSEVKKANLYFRIASGLPNQSAEYRAAAIANLELTSIQLRTLRSELASESKRTSIIARIKHPKQ